MDIKVLTKRVLVRSLASLVRQFGILPEWLVELVTYFFSSPLLYDITAH